MSLYYDLYKQVNVEKTFCFRNKCKQLGKPQNFKPCQKACLHTRGLRSEILDRDAMKRNTMFLWFRLKTAFVQLFCVRRCHNLISWTTFSWFAFMYDVFMIRFAWSQMFCYYFGDSTLISFIKHFYSIFMLQNFDCS